jgi:DNA-binding transcriptional LysR family regulator
MMDWDDIRYFLAVARGGSLRAGAEHLGVRHSTVLRRISQLEERLGALLFDRLPSGYRLTATGQDVLELAEEMASASNRLETRILGRDQGVRGQLRVTMTSMLATHLLMTDFAQFAQDHPEIGLEIIPSDVPANLTNREADVAIRVVYEESALPLNLHGLKGPEVFGGVYMSKALLVDWRQKPLPVRWILKEFDGIPDWARASEVAIADVPFSTTDAGTHIAAIRQGIGMTSLPCFVGDADPVLVRVPGSRVHKHGRLYVLTQGETRRTKRVQLFTGFISKRLASHAALLAGDAPRARDKR